MLLFSLTIEKEKIRIGRLVFEKVLFFFNARATVLILCGVSLKVQKKEEEAEAAATLQFLVGNKRCERKLGRMRKNVG